MFLPLVTKSLSGTRLAPVPEPGITLAPVVRPKSWLIVPRYSTFGEWNASHWIEWASSTGIGGQDAVGIAGCCAQAVPVTASVKAAVIAARRGNRMQASTPRNPETCGFRGAGASGIRHALLYFSAISWQKPGTQPT